MNDDGEGARYMWYWAAIALLILICLAVWLR